LLSCPHRWLSTSHPALSKIIYTETDEAPMLATYSLLPVIQRFAVPLGIQVGRRSETGNRLS
jgi:monomeric isocitrate dehydrogenase